MADRETASLASAITSSGRDALIRCTQAVIKLLEKEVAEAGPSLPGARSRSEIDLAAARHELAGLVAGHGPVRSRCP